MIPKNIITLAIEGGWRPVEDWEKYLGIEQTDGQGVVFSFTGFIDDQNDPNYGKTYRSRIHIRYDTVVCDKTFWQALGKALGWEDFDERYTDNWQKWKLNAECFYGLILTGGNVEAYWKELLATHK